MELAEVRKRTVTVTQLAVAILLSLVIGLVGAIGVGMYARHNRQHLLMEQFIQNQQQFNSQVAAAFNDLNKK